MSIKCYFIKKLHFNLDRIMHHVNLPTTEKNHQLNGITYTYQISLLFICLYHHPIIQISSYNSNNLDLNFDTYQRVSFRFSSFNLCKKLLFIILTSTSNLKPKTKQA